MLDNIVEVKKITSSMIRYLEAEKNYNLAEILKGAYPSSEEIAYDNWNGGTYIYSFVYEIEIDTYQKEDIAKIMFSKDTISRKRIAIRKLKKKGLTKKYIQLFLRLLEYISEF